jgi:hypothetical protein
LVGSEEPKRRLCIYAYRAVPWEFNEEAAPRLLEPKHLFARDYPIPLPEPDLSGYQRLGYDVVEFRPYVLLDFEDRLQERSGTLWPGNGHSPLSCNGLAGHYPVNEFCLLEDVDAAFQAGRNFGREQPEPGSYIIVEVLRRCDREVLGRDRVSQWSLL